VLRDRGVYLITGGTGGIGLTLAGHLARSVRARLILVARTEMPDRGEWARLSAERPAGDPVAERIRSIEAIERLGGEVLVVAADVTRAAEMSAAVRAARARFGSVDGVIHAAGVAGGGLAALKTREAAAAVLAPKVQGLAALHAALEGEPLDFLLLCSSLHGVVGGLGQIDYAAANAVLDLYAQDRWTHGETYVTSVNWDAWREVGMAVNTPIPEDIRQRRDESLRHAITPQEGCAVFDAIVGCGLPQVVVYAQDFDALLAAAVAAPGHEGTIAGAEPARPRHPRPPLPVAFVAPRTPLERSVCEAFEKVLGLEQVGIHDSFFDLGGHSLLAVRVMTRVNQALGIELPVAKLYEGLTVSFLVEQVAPAPAEEDEQDNAERRRDKAKRQREHQQRRRVALGR
jgi:NAD(P)-dependent dehydrogenase (short-subunit alcohol dehydrogenase family)/acyl carrier protein